MCNELAIFPENDRKNNLFWFFFKEYVDEQSFFAIFFSRLFLYVFEDLLSFFLSFKTAITSTELWAVFDDNSLWS